MNEANKNPCPYRKYIVIEEGKQQAKAVSKVGLANGGKCFGEKVKQRRVMESAGDEDT